jgi:hypothetical protein
MYTRRQLLVRGAAFALTLGHGKAAFSALDVSVQQGEEGGKLITPATRKAIESGLKFLSDAQHADGSYGTGPYKGNVGVTSLAGLVFFAAGHQPDDSPRGKIISKAVEFILSQENRSGVHPGFLHNPDASPHGPMYSHGFATLLLAYLRGKGKDKKQATKRDEVLERAVKLIVTSQNKDGGWRYMPTSRDADSTVTSGQMMALAVARQSGLTVPEKTINAGVSYIKRCFMPATGAFMYMLQGGGKPMYARTAAAVAALQAMGVHKGEELEKGLDYVIKNRPAAAPRPDMHYYYGLYYAARVMHKRGGAGRKDWFVAASKELLGEQQGNGSWNHVIDSHYATAMACLVLLMPEGRLMVQSEQKKD